MTEQELTYPEVGSSLVDPLPAGYHHLVVRRRLGGPELLDRAGAFVLDWGMQRGAGIRVDDAAGPVVEGRDYVLHLGPLPIPVRIVRVLQEPDRRGFVYGTLPGHPETGEEAFLVERDHEGTWVVIRAFSVGGRWFSRLGGPVTRVIQTRMTERYVRSAVQALR